MHRTTLLTFMGVFAVTACADSATGPQVDARPATPSYGKVAAIGDFQRYVAIGTSVSQGWRSDGVNAASQRTSWPAQLAELAGRELSLPLIAFPGCGAPLAAPLAAGLRVSGEPAAAPLLSRICSPNEPGVTLPTGNVAISGARTSHALTATPEQPDPSYAPLYSRVLAPGMSQVTAMEAQNPKIVSVELGANEILGASNGAYVPGQTVIPVAVWQPIYHQVIERVAAATKHAVLVGLIDNAINFPAFRLGAELWAARATFAPFNVSVSEDCSVLPGSTNALFVPVRVALAVGDGAARARAGLSAAVLSCANAPATGANGLAIRDYVLSQAELAQLDAQFAAMNAIIRAEAEAHGFAYFALSALYDQANTKAPFSAITLLTSQQPFGPLIGLDGIHPSAEGARVLAEAAAEALAARYNMFFPNPGAPLAMLLRQ
jgi:GDSL-like Lipase/Acylhydrolase